MGTSDFCIARGSEAECPPGLVVGGQSGWPGGTEPVEPGTVSWPTVSQQSGSVGCPAGGPGLLGVGEKAHTAVRVL